MKLPSFVYILTFIILFLVLVVFADTFIFALGTIGLVVTFAANYKDQAHTADHH
ncbi:hypothetical protein CLV98_101821 [Dyadobacter jejuensis]|uniref:Uncharacterized protein n=1 Tax=Dyadobacter jejuensis TaxID=1082580 RepID=A0A316ATE8_9BACT|nr:hypothetical protein CLV98_101821 [Dyadobacter jejuensis]